MITDLKKDIVYRRIKELIITGFYPMGSKISEGMLEKELGSNKAPIRDALKCLAAEKLVERRPKSGTYVFSLSADELDEMLHFRYVIESEAAMLSLRFEPNLLEQEIDIIVDAMEQSLKHERINDYLRLDSRFHEQLVCHCGNRYFTESFAMIAAIMDTVRNCLGSNQLHLQRSYTQHKLIASCIAKRDFEQFKELYKTHLLAECGSYWAPENIKDKMKA